MATSHEDLRPRWLRFAARLPLGLLYAIARALMFIVYRVLRHRLAIVRANMAGCFPDWSAGELSKQVTAHYYGVADVIAEAFKAAGMETGQFAGRVTLQNLEVPRAFLAQGKPVLMLAAHQGNWDWVLQALVAGLGHPLDAVYKPIRSPWADRMMLSIRTRHGAHLVAGKDLLADILKRRDRVRAIALLGDQEPLPTTPLHWVRFMGRDTAFFAGPEQIVRATRYGACYVALRRVRRGEYEVDFIPLAAPGESLKPGEFTERYAALVEASVRASPADWTWGHRRWKLKRGLYAPG